MSTTLTLREWTFPTLKGDLPMNDVPTNPPVLPADALPADALTEEEVEAGRIAYQQAVNDLREDKRRQAARLAIWQPALRDLTEADDVASMAESFIAVTQLCGWNENEDDRLARLAVGIVKALELSVTVERHRNRPDVVRIGGYLVSLNPRTW
jgi:hypothetical protein